MDDDLVKGSAAAVEYVYPSQLGELLPNFRLSDSCDDSQVTITTTSGSIGSDGTKSEQMEEVAVIMDCLAPDEQRSRSQSKIEALRSRLNSVFR